MGFPSESQKSPRDQKADLGEPQNGHLGQAPTTQLAKTFPSPGGTWPQLSNRDLSLATDELKYLNDFPQLQFTPQPLAPGIHRRRRFGHPGVGLGVAGTLGPIPTAGKPAGRLESLADSFVVRIGRDDPDARLLAAVPFLDARLHATNAAIC